tara:strand:+ start:43213 stop:43740 length:528 start_codon:yes stop_codon:yes gene_type:complete
MAKWKLILDDTYIVSKSGRVQVANSIWSKPKNRDLPNFWNAAGDLAVMIDYQKEKKNISVALLVAHAFVDGFDAFNNDHTVQLIDTSKRTKLKNIMAHVPQDIPESVGGSLPAPIKTDKLDGIGMSSTEWNDTIKGISKAGVTIKDASSDKLNLGIIIEEMAQLIQALRKHLNNN